MLQVPLALSVWDDGYGISVPISMATTKSSISDALRGFIPDDRPGIDIHVLRGWDYAGLVDGYLRVIERVRAGHKPAIFHVVEITQPQGPSFAVEGNRVRWQKWNFVIGFNAREGLTLHDLRYDDDGRERPVLYRASLTEMVVPYGDPTYVRSATAWSLSLARPERMKPRPSRATWPRARR